MGLSDSFDSGIVMCKGKAAVRHCGMPSSLAPNINGLHVCI